MGVKEWVGVVFLAVLAVFFMVAYFVKGHGGNTLIILRVLAAMSAGVAGLLLTGAVVAEFRGQIPSSGVSFTVNAAGAVALFLIIWLTFPSEKVITTVPEFVASFPPATQFYQAAIAIGKKEACTVELNGFTDSQKAVQLNNTDLRAPSVEHALRDLWKLVPKKSLPHYEVQKTSTGFSLTV